MPYPLLQSAISSTGQVPPPCHRWVVPYSTPLIGALTTALGRHFNHNHAGSYGLIRSYTESIWLNFIDYVKWLSRGKENSFSVVYQEKRVLSTAVDDDVTYF